MGGRVVLGVGMNAENVGAGELAELEGPATEGVAPEGAQPAAKIAASSAPPMIRRAVATWNGVAIRCIYPVNSGSPGTGSGGGAGAALTIRNPCMNGWITQLYSYVPATDGAVIVRELP